MQVTIEEQVLDLLDTIDQWADDDFEAENEISSPELGDDDVDENFTASGYLLEPPSHKIK